MKDSLAKQLEDALSSMATTIETHAQRVGANPRGKPTRKSHKSVRKPRTILEEPPRMQAHEETDEPVVTDDLERRVSRSEQETSDSIVQRDSVPSQFRTNQPAKKSSKTRRLKVRCKRVAVQS